MKYTINYQEEFNPRSGRGYYSASPVRYKLFAYVDTDDILSIDGRAAFAFMPEERMNEWFIGAHYIFDRPAFQLLGPYPTAAFAVRMMELLGFKNNL